MKYEKGVLTLIKAAKGCKLECDLQESLGKYRIITKIKYSSILPIASDAPLQCDREASLNNAANFMRL